MRCVLGNRSWRLKRLWALFLKRHPHFWSRQFGIVTIRAWSHLLRLSMQVERPHKRVLFAVLLHSLMYTSASGVLNDTARGLNGANLVCGSYSCPLFRSETMLTHNVKRRAAVHCVFSRFPLHTWYQTLRLRMLLC